MVVPIEHARNTNLCGIRQEAGNMQHMLRGKPPFVKADCGNLKIVNFDRLNAN